MSLCYFDYYHQLEEIKDRRAADASSWHLDHETN